MDVLLGVGLGWVIVAGLFLTNRLAPRSLFFGQSRSMKSALHAATVMLPDLRRGLTPESARRAAPHLRTLTQATAIALADGTDLLAFDGLGADHHGEGDGLLDLLREGSDEGVHIEAGLACAKPGCPLRAAILAPLTVQGQRVGSLIAFYASAERLTPEDGQVIGEAASLVSAQVELSALEAQGERLARAELRALRAQISPHFIYNALAAVASYIHSRPEEARELLSEFAEFIRYAFRGQRPFVTLADELEYVEKYLRLEQARFGERLQVRWEVEPRVLPTVVPVLSVQPLVENAVRHGLERRGGSGVVQIIARDLEDEVELRVIDDGMGMNAARASAALTGASDDLTSASDTPAAVTGIGLSNVQARLQGTFGEDYGLRIESQLGRGTTVTMLLPKRPPAVRAA